MLPCASKTNLESMGIDEEVTESLWVRIKGKARESDIIVRVCCRPPDQEDQVDQALYKQIGEASCSQVLLLLADLKHPGVCWKDHTAGCQQSERLLECIFDDFLLQVVKESTKKCAMLDLILSNKEGLVSNVKLKDSLGCSNHEIEDLKILEVSKKV